MRWLAPSGQPLDAPHIGSMYTVLDGPPGAARAPAEDPTHRCYSIGAERELGRQR